MALFTVTINNLSPALDHQFQEVADDFYDGNLEFVGKIEGFAEDARVIHAFGQVQVRQGPVLDIEVIADIFPVAADDGALSVQD